MKKLIIAFLMAFSSAAMSAGGGVHLDAADIDLADQASLQRGAKLFVNYCQGCHSLKFQRYQRMADDIGLTHDEVKENMLFSGGKIGDHMTSAIDQDAAAKWFGTVPPDLSVIARSRGVDWVYTYLRSFVPDAKRPFGVNNTVFKDVGMPHVMQDVQNSMSQEEFDGAMRDLTAFLSYVGEPVQLERKRIGVYVILFLVVFTVLAYLMKKEYWKDVH
jgi:ubiquinol-cytochrome c reductase cytochrome c1 subunit